MRPLLTAILVLASQILLALPSPSESIQKFSFRFAKFEGETYQYEIKAGTQEEAFRKAADACFTHFKGNRHISMDYGQDIIDICVNPRSI